MSNALSMQRSMLRVVIAAVLIHAAVLSPVAGGAEFEVDSTLDAVDSSPGDGVCMAADGECTLRAAVMESNALEGADVIRVPAGLYELTIEVEVPRLVDDSVGDLDITDVVTLEGEGIGATILDGSGTGDRVLTVYSDWFVEDPPSVRIVGLTLTGGTATSYGGGCLLVETVGEVSVERSEITGCDSGYGWGGGVAFMGGEYDATFRLVDSIVADNTAAGGGGLYGFRGEIELIRSVVRGNTAITSFPNGFQGGGGISLASNGFTSIDSDISSNTAGRTGGGIHAHMSWLHLDRTTVSNNQALERTGSGGSTTGNGGGLWMDRTTLVMTNSTLSGNSAVRQGGGLYSDTFGEFQIAFSTIAGNSHDSDLDGAGLTVLGAVSRPPDRFQSFKGTVLAGNTAHGRESNCFFTEVVESGGYNVVADASCELTAPTDLATTDPMLGVLADNGGFAPTHALTAGSPALALVPIDECRFEIDNDWDGEIDEDPVDGVDDDGDYRVDEDPVEIADVDQRGALRLVGEACDAGAFEVEAAPETVIEELIIDVQELIDDGEINRGRGRSLIAELQVALWFLKFHNGERIAAIRIQLFIIKVERLVDNGDLEPELGDELLVKARALLAMLQDA